MPIINFTPAVAQVRALIPDVEEIYNSAVPNGPKEYIFTDAHLTSLLALNGGVVRLAAADACEALGSSEALILKVITTEDLQTNGAALLNAWLGRADRLRAQARREEMDISDSIEFIPFFVEPAHWELR